jgi:hypothetical protein
MDIENVLDHARDEMARMKRNHSFEDGYTVAGIDMMDSSLYFVGHYATIEEAQAAARSIAPEEGVIYKPGWTVAE